MNICTIIAKNYVAHARVLAESFLAVDPDGTCSVLIIDDFVDQIDPAVEPFEVVEIDQIGLPDHEQMAASYDVVEFSTAVKPWLLRHLLQRPEVEAVTYLDPDIWITDSLAEVDRLAKRHGVVLTPHFTAPLPRDGHKPSEEDILIAGTYNLGFIALGAGETADALLDWWSERLERDCVIDPERGHFVDQRWIDLVPGLWPDLHILRDPGYNVAYWNFPSRDFELDGDRYRVDGEPLRFFHFSGFDPLKPAELSRHQTRIDVARSPALSRICSGYATELLDHDQIEAKGWPYGWGLTANGIRLDRAARRLHREAVDAAALDRSIFSRRGAKRFAGYLNEASDGSRGNGGVSRYAKAVRDSRADLREAFPDVEGRDAAAFTRWLHAHAGEMRISESLLSAATSAGSNRAAEPTEDRRPRRAQMGVNLVGYLSSELGVGEAARQVHSALEAAGVPSSTVDVPVAAAQMPAALGNLSEADIPFDFNLICVNADMLPELAGSAGEGLFGGRHSAGLWFWEIAQFPQRWRGSFKHLDEVWVASEHVAEAVRALAPVPVETIRVPIAPTPPAQLSRVELGMPEGFCFLFIFDYRSVFKRKNPLGIVQAFGAAFEPSSGPSLVIKSISSDAYPAEREALLAAVKGRSDIKLIDETVEAATKNAMIASCDCYVSLHRSEGLGLTMAEAMYFERPVIATAYSGNLDFMTAENSYLVEHSIAKIGTGAAPYPADAEWAEPDLQQASALMKQAFEQPGDAAERGRRAGVDIRRTHSPAAAGALFEARLTAVRRQRVLARFDDPEDPAPEARTADSRPRGDLVPVASRLPAPSGDPATGRAQLHHLLRLSDVPPRRDAGRFRTLLKRLYMRLLRPYSSYQRRINASSAAAIDELGAMLNQLEGRAAKSEEAAGSRLDNELSRLRAQLGKVAAETSGALAAGLDDTNARLSDGLDEVRARLDEAQTGWQALETRLKQSGAERDEYLGREIAAADAKLAEVEDGLRKLSDDVDATFDRDRGLVGTLRASHERFSVETEMALADLKGYAKESSAVIQAGQAKPYMAEERFAGHSHPLLGEVIGFRSDPNQGPSHGYRGFEDLFRGPEEMIRDRQQVYTDLTAGFAPVLDAGCGRGEFLDLLKEKGVESRGVDLDPEMVARCREKGHVEVEQADLLDHLEQTPAGSLGTVFSAQVIEHLQLDQLQRLLALSLTRLRPGGLLIAETVNPHSPAALKTFWVDPTHRQPLFPETMLALCQLAGFPAADVFSPLGSGDWEKDRLTTGEYAIVAVAPERGA